MKKTIIVTREAEHIDVISESPFEAYWLMFGHIIGTEDEVEIRFPHVSNFEDEVFQDENADPNDYSNLFDWDRFEVLEDGELIGDENSFDYIQREETLRQMKGKTYRVANEYIDEWGADAPEGTTVTAAEVIRLAAEWGKDIEELLPQLEEVSESKARLQAVQEKLKLNQKQLGIYIGVSARTVNAWMGKKETRECADYIVEMAERLADVDARALENGEPTTTMMRWAVIDETHTDTFITVCGDKADALREGQTDWDHLTAWEKENDVVHFSVGLIRVQLTEDHGKRTFEQALLEDGISADGDIYDVAKEWK